MTSVFHQTVRGITPGRTSPGELRPLREAADLERFVDGIEECVQLTPGRFSGYASTVHAGAVAIHELTIDRGVHLRFAEDADRIVIGLLLSDERVIQAGLPWTKRQVVVGCESRVDANTIGPSSMLWLTVSRQALSSADREALSSLHGTFAADASFFETVRRLAAHRVDDAAVLERTVVFALRRVAPFVRPADEHRSVTLVENVERYMWDNVEEPLTLERVAKEMNCSVRALIYAFKDVYGVGPMTYWKARRINSAHRKLRASQGKVPILEIAADFGFWHMGHFSADHKTMFGMTPSQAIEAGRAG